MKNDFKKIGAGRLQLRQGGKHLLLVKGKKSKSSKFYADKFVDSEVILYVEVVSSEKIKRRKSSPRI